MAGGTTPDDGQGLRERLQFIVNERNQADVARATNTVPNNVGRYLRGTKMPAEFLCALIRAYGVNPVWLMTGEGTPYLSDVTSTTEDTAANVLDLVRAMDAVASMKLGALTGKNHLKIMRELNDLLVVFERHRGALNAQTSDIMRQVLKDLNDAITRKKRGPADQALKAAQQLAKLCNDDALEAELVRTEALYEFVFGNEERAIELQRRAFFRFFSDRSALDERGCYEILSFAAVLIRSYRMREARRVLLAGADLTADVSGFETMRARFAAGAGFVGVEFGDIRASLANFYAAFGHFSPAERDNFSRFLVRALVLSASVPLDACAAEHWPPKASEAEVLRLACLFERADVASDMLERFTGKGADARGEQQVELLYAEAFVKVSKRASSKIVSEFREAVTEGIRQPEIQAFWLETASTQLYRLCGDAKNAKRCALSAAAAFARIPEDFTAPLTSRILHYSNVLKLGEASLEGALAGRARAFFDEYVRAGYFALQALVEPDTAKK
ncbi:MAG: helix-turn-helix transcriptional regulator [Planctomycetaceae bacterium]|nr:helix-turn-helix transcriptional regulator [Planctomycetaceae bacterium]